jgi:hypothetical protein
MTQTNWTLRDELIELTQRWPLLVLVFLVGSLLGWAASVIFPATYEARTELYVAFNGDSFLRNPDDYKNWQMEQLDAFLFSEPVLTATVEILAESPVKVKQTVITLPENLDVLWRNAGRWTLVASAQTPEVAAAIVQAWEDAALTALGEASAAAKELLRIERDLGQVSDLRYTAQSNLLQLNLARDSLKDLLDQIIKTETAPDQLAYWSLQLLVGQALGNDPASAQILELLPAPDADWEAYSVYRPQVLAALDQREVSLSADLAFFEKQQTDLTDQWQAAEQAAAGITAYLTVEPLNAGQITTEATRATGAAAMVGGLCGLLGLFFYRLAKRGWK